MNNRGPIITYRTTLAELESKGATTLSDIPLNELLEFVRNSCLGGAEDSCDEFAEGYAEAAEAVQRAIEAIDRSHTALHTALTSEA